MLCREVDGTSVACDASHDGEIATLFEKVDEACRSLFVVDYYARTYSQRPVAELDFDVALATFSVSVWGALLVPQQAARRMLTQDYGTMLFTGASAGSKGYGPSAQFAMGKFALRRLCQSLAHELSPQNIHVVHIDNDGVVLEAERGAPYNSLTCSSDPDEIPRTYLQLADQHNGAWFRKLGCALTSSCFEPVPSAIRPATQKLFFFAAAQTFALR
jgi:NAD(P)-dependent dehydrogenase (short-subunit alcohol dehydrogenase family)